MGFRRRSRVRSVVLTPALASLAFACAAMLSVLGALAPLAWAEACPGSGAAAACPYTATVLIGQRAESVLRFPEAVAVDASGDVYVADQLGYTVQKFGPAGEFLTQWGSYGGGHGQFGPIGGIATDAEGNVYVVDSSHNRIEKFDSSGSFLLSWGHSGSGLGDFRFFSSLNPTQPPGGGIAVAGDYVFVADSGNNRIERFNLNGEEPMQWGSKGEGAGQFSYPRGVAANASEVLVADDDNHRIEKFNLDGEFEALAGSHGTGPGQYGFPYGVALDGAGYAFVADDLNHRVVELNPQLEYVRAWGGYGQGPGQFAFPRAVASDAAGDVYVADTANDRVQLFNPAGAFVRAIGTSARGPGVLTAPRGLAVDPSGRLFVSDTVDDRIEAFGQGGAPLLLALERAGGHAPGFAEPSGIAMDPRGSLYVADTGNERVVHLWGEGTYLSEIGGPADRGGAGLSGARSVAVSAASGDLYVADTNHNRVLIYSPKGNLLTRVGANEGDGAAGEEPGQFNHPTAVAVSPASGKVFVADSANNRVVELSPEGAYLDQFGALGSGDGRLHDPAGVAVDAAGRVFVVDSLNDRVEEFDESGHFLAKWGRRGEGVGELSFPTAVAVGCEGSVYVADTDNNRVERFDPASPAGTGCQPSGSWPPPLDVAPVLHVSLSRSGSVLARRAVALSVSCQRGCKILVSASLATRSPLRRASLVSVARALPPSVTGHVRLRLTPSALRHLRRALGRQSSLVAVVQVVAVGPTGRRTVLHRDYLVTR